MARKFTVSNVLPVAVKVTHDKELMRDPMEKYQEAEVTVNVEDLNGLTVEVDEDGNGESDVTVARTKNTQISLEPNPRVQVFTTAVAREIEKSLLKRDGKFHHKNNGIKITADSFTYDNQAKKFSWTELDPLIHGNLDGGHTLSIIDRVVGGEKWKNVAAEVIERGDKLVEQFVRMRVVAGVDTDEVPDIADALNTAVPVEDAALENLVGSFKFVEDELKKPDKRGDLPKLLEMIAFKQNQIRLPGYEIRIEKVLQHMTVLNNREWTTDEKQPYQAYWSRIKNVNSFVERKDEYHRLRRLIPDALALPEYIILKYGEWYLQSGGGRFGSTRECKTVEEKTHLKVLPIIRPGQPEFADYQLKSDGLAMPLLGALRVLVSDDETAQWLTDPYRFLDEVGPTLVDTLHSAVTAQRNVVSVLKDKGTWKSVYLNAKLRAMEKGIIAPGR